MSRAGWIEVDAKSSEGMGLRVGGEWTVTHAGDLDRELRKLEAQGVGRLVVDAGEIDVLDTAGAWLLERTLELWGEDGAKAELRGLGESQAVIFEQVAKRGAPYGEVARSPGAFLGLLQEVGEATLDMISSGRQILDFTGRTLVVFLRTLWRPARWRFTSLVHHLERVGLNALPIVGLISFLIGIVLAYQGAAQLEQFGANVFVVDLIGVSVLRELGILLTAIVVAGRSGSTFTAELGAMQLNEEVDALRTLGLDPMEVLVLPRTLALVISLPLLAFYADLMGLLGGGLLAWGVLDISPHAFVERLQNAVDLTELGVGIVKAPVFAAVIALVGCSQGLAVRGSSESLGTNTTRSVVQSIFLVIVLDALFSIFFNLIGV